MKMKKNKKISGSVLVISIVMLIWALVIFYPFYYAVLISFMSEKEYLRSSFKLFPDQPTLDAYRQVISSQLIWTGYRSTLVLVIVGVPFNLFLTTTVAYALSKRKFPGKKFISLLVIFTMYFSGGMMPTYLLIRNLGLIDSLWAIILSSGVNVYYMIIIKNYFAGIPESIEDAAKIDGANDVQIMLRIYLPMSTPILATYLLFFLVDRWNEWYSSLLYLTDSKKWPLQLVLREMIAGEENDMLGYISSIRNQFSMGIKMAAVVVTMLPIMLAFPFLQKYFIKGMVVGAVKE